MPSKLPVKHTAHSKRFLFLSMLIATLTVAGCGATKQPPASQPAANTPAETDKTDDTSAANQAPPASLPVDTTKTEIEVELATTYKNGTYSAVGSYVSPAGPENVEVVLTLKNDLVIDATVVGKATATRSKTMQADFIAHYKEFVVGKNIAELTLGKVSGSSLTPRGFNNAVDKIQAAAKA